MRTNQATMVSADWNGVERETVEKIRLLKVLVKQLEPGPLPQGSGPAGCKAGASARRAANPTPTHVRP